MVLMEYSQKLIFQYFIIAVGEFQNGFWDSILVYTHLDRL